MPRRPCVAMMIRSQCWSCAVRMMASCGRWATITTVVQGTSASRAAATSASRLARALISSWSSPTLWSGGANSAPGTVSAGDGSATDSAMMRARCDLANSMAGPMANSAMAEPSVGNRMVLNMGFLRWTAASRGMRDACCPASVSARRVKNLDVDQIATASGGEGAALRTIFQYFHGLPANADATLHSCKQPHQARRARGWGAFFSRFTKTCDSILFADIPRYFVLADAIAELKTTKRL